jgi:hypothetical protein
MTKGTWVKCVYCGGLVLVLGQVVYPVDGEECPKYAGCEEHYHLPEEPWRPSNIPDSQGTIVTATTSATTTPTLAQFKDYWKL